MSFFMICDRGESVGVSAMLGSTSGLGRRVESGIGCACCQGSIPGNSLGSLCVLSWVGSVPGLFTLVPLASSMADAATKAHELISIF